MGKVKVYEKVVVDKICLCLFLEIECKVKLLFCCIGVIVV